MSFPAIGIGSGVLGFRPYWCPSPFPLPFILGVFHSLLSAIGFQSCFFFTADVSPPIRSTLHLLTFWVSFQAWDWLWYPMLWSQRRSRKLDPNFCPGRGRTSDLGIYRAPLLLVASYDMQEATAGHF